MKDLFQPKWRKLPLKSEDVQYFINGEKIEDASATKLTPITPADIYELYKQMPKPEFSMTDRIQFAMRECIEELDKHFLEVLKKRGISEEEFSRFGYAKVVNGVNYYFYKGERIFFHTIPEVAEYVGSGEFKYTVYYGEVE